MTAARSLLLGLLLGLPGSSAFGSPLSIYGFWPRDIGMAGAAGASEPGPGAAWINPASAAFAKDQTLGMGFSLFQPAVFVDRGRPFCGDAPSACDASHPGGWSPVEEMLPDRAAGILLGWVKPLGGVFQDRVGLAASLYLPTRNILMAEGVDSSVPHYLMYQDLSDKLEFAFSVAGRPLSWLSIGAGVRVITDVTADVSVSVDALGHGFTRQDISVSILPKVGALAGLMARPLEGLSLSFVYRQELPLVFRVPARVGLGDLVTFDLEVEGIVLYSPHQFELGAAYRFESLDLEIAAQTNLSLWSRMRDGSPRIDIDLQGALLAGLGLDQALDLRETGDRPLLGLRDVWTVHLGAEWGPSERVQLRAGYQFRPTPVPRQTGARSLLDNPAHGLGIGIGVVLGDLFGTHRAPVHLDVGLMMLILPRQTVRKAPDDPVGSLSHGGIVYGGGVSLSHAY